MSQCSILLCLCAIAGHAQDTLFYQSVKWSPDQKRIAVCVGARHGRTNIFTGYVISMKPLRVEASFDNAFFPVFSPDGKSVAFSRKGPNKNSAIWRYNLATGDSIPIVGAEFNNGGVGFSPDGRQICFTSNRGGKSAVYIANSEDGAGIHRLNADTTAQYSPAWSPKGDKIVYYCAKGDGHDQVYVADLKNKGIAKRITGDSTHNYYPSWGADDHTIVFVTTDPAKKRRGCHRGLQYSNRRNPGQFQSERALCIGFAGWEKDCIYGRQVPHF